MPKCAETHQIHTECVGVAVQRQELKFGSRVAVEGLSVSADGLVLTKTEAAGRWCGGMEPPVSTAERSYVEWVIEEADANVNIMLGVTGLEAAPAAGTGIYESPCSRMYYCANSKAYAGSGRNWGVTGRRSKGDRVGLLVHGGSLSVYVNGELLGQGPMATDLPAQVVWVWGWVECVACKLLHHC